MEQPKERAAEPNIDVRVFTTHASSPEDGQVFVWAVTRWYERIEEDTGGGGAGFVLIADNEEDLRARLMERRSDLGEIDDEFAVQVRDEFSDVMALEMFADDLSDARPSSGDEPEADSL